MSASATAVSQDYLTIEQVAQTVGMSHQFIRKAIRNGEGPTVTQLGARPRISRQALAEWLASRVRPTRAEQAA